MYKLTLLKAEFICLHLLLIVQVIVFVFIGFSMFFYFLYHLLLLFCLVLSDSLLILYGLCFGLSPLAFVVRDVILIVKESVFLLKSGTLAVLIKQFSKYISYNCTQKKKKELETNFFHCITIYIQM